MISRENEVLDEVTVVHMPGAAYRTRWLVMTSPWAREKLCAWMRHLSDGYVLFDRDDIYAKIEGPVIVEDLAAESALTCVGLYGPNAGGLLGSAHAAPFTMSDLRFGKASAKAVCVKYTERLQGFEILLEPSDVQAVWGDLSNNAVPVGEGRLRMILKEEGLPNPDSPSLSAVDYVRGKGAIVDYGKHYFIGQRGLLQEAPACSKERFTFSAPEGEPKKTWLYEEHRALTSRSLVPFAGWLMPVWYTRIADEHRAVREAAGLFDVSHMGVFEFSGRGAARVLDALTTNYVPRLELGQSHYGYALDTEGSVLDDLMIYRRGQEKYMMVVNAANADKMKAWFIGALEGRYLLDEENPAKILEGDVTFRDLKDPASGADGLIDLALQGPASLSILMSMAGSCELRARIQRLGKARLIEENLEGFQVVISRTGYTGEDIGYELFVHPDRAPTFWRLLLERGRPFGLKPTGLGCRDSLRTEAGLPLYGHELAGSNEILPSGAGYASFVKLHKPFFVGKKGYMEREKKRTAEIVRFRMRSKGLRMIKTGSPVVDYRGNFIGKVTSSVVVDGIQIGLAYVSRSYAKEGAQIGVFLLPEDRGVQEKQKDSLAAGDRVLLHEEGAIISRFPMRQ
jgi:glycine hydroxymethyltransferase